MKRNYSVFLLTFIVLFTTQVAIEFGAAEITKGPYLSNATQTSIVISWETVDAGNSVIEYAEEAKYTASGGAYDLRVEGQNNVKRHSIILKDLAPFSAYHYRVVSDPAMSQDSKFRTAVRANEAFTLVVYGDTRTNANNHQAVINEMIKHNPDLVVNSGDLVENGAVLSQWDTFFNTTKDLLKSVPYYPVLGNHEGNAQNYYDLFYLPSGGGKDGEEWYSFDYGNAHFIFLDSNYRNSLEQQAWLENDLAQSFNKAQWTFVTFHHPPYSSSSHGSEYATMPKWIEAFEKYRVDMVFGGHDHVYERSLSNDIWYIVAGGGGAPFYSVNMKPNPKQVYAETALHFCKLRIYGTALKFEMIRADGTVGDSFVVDRPTEVKYSGKLPVTWGKIKKY